MVPEEAIRQRSYLIWLQDGCPDGKALEHWARARAELDAEYLASCCRSGDWRHFVMPRLPILHPPRREISKRIAPNERATAAKRQVVVR